MKIIGIIAEYNPFHLGHLYQINKIKELYPNSLIIALVSTNFTERGDISILNKWQKTQICLENNIDLVAEFPTLYSTQSSDIFAKYALKILNDLKIDTLVFGSESNDLEYLKQLATTQINNPKYDNLVKSFLDTGINYPTAMNKALKVLINQEVNLPNDLLGLSYIKEIIKNNYQITPISIKRTNDYHEDQNNIHHNQIISANLIRKLLKENKDIKPYIPIETYNQIINNNPITINDAYNLLKYKIILNKDNLNKYLTVDEGIENRIINSINKSNNWEELVKNIKTKRYTYNKINRMLIHILLDITKEDNIDSPYIHILGFNSKGRTYLNKIKKDITYPIYKSYQANQNIAFDTEFKSTYIYSIITNQTNLILKEYQTKPIIKD